MKSQRRNQPRDAWGAPPSRIQVPKLPKLIVVFDIDQTLIDVNSNDALYHPEFVKIFKLIQTRGPRIHTFLYTNGLTHLNPKCNQIFQLLGDVRWFDKFDPRTHPQHDRHIIRDVFAGGTRLNRPVPPGWNALSYMWRGNPPFLLPKRTDALRSYLAKYYNRAPHDLPRIAMFDDCGCDKPQQINRAGWKLVDDDRFKLHHIRFSNGRFSPILSLLIDEIVRSNA